MSATAPVPSIDADVDVAGLYRKHLSSGRARVTSMMGGQVEISSSGSVVTDHKGDDYLNCGGYGVFLIGHCHPRVVEAVRAQAEKHPLTTRLLFDGTQALAAQAMVSIAPEGITRVLFSGGGAEAVEGALKLGRMHGKRRIVSTLGGFHGKSFGAISVSGNATLREPFQPLVPDVTHLPHGDAKAIRDELAEHPGECMVILEPIQGEGGVNIPPKGYLREVADACKEFDALLILDEIATGLGRCGSTFWVCEQEGVTPDILIFGKPISGGVVPVSGIAATEEAFKPLDRDPFMHMTTFSGSPIQNAAVISTVQVLVDERVPERSAELGERIVKGLHEVLAEGFEMGLVKEIRYAGLMIAIEMAEPHYAGELEMDLIANKVIPNHCMNSHSVMRLTPSALMTEEELDWLLRAMGTAMGEVVARQKMREAAA